MPLYERKVNNMQVIHFSALRCILTFFHTYISKNCTIRAVTLTENEHVFMMVFSENYIIITDKNTCFMVVKDISVNHCI